MQFRLLPRSTRLQKPLLTALSLLWAASVCSQTPQPDPIRVIAGPMVGHVWDAGAKVWVQIDRGASISLDVRKVGTQDWIPSRYKAGNERYTRAWPDTGNTATATIDGLEPSTRYEYRLRSRDFVMPAAGEQTFKTPPKPGDPEDFSVGFGSCASNWGPDPNQPIWTAIDQLHPDVFLFLGDNVYYDREGQEWAHPEKMWARYQQGRSLPILQPVLRRTACYAIWDDHDYGPDDSDKIYMFKDLTLHIFRNYWPNPTYGSDGVEGIWHRFTRGKVEFFMLDGRTYRDAEDAPNDEFKSMLGAAQKSWLEKVLKSSKATFKVIVSGSQVLSRYHEFESFDQFTTERNWLMDVIRKNDISGVVFLSGDRHMGEVLRWQPPEVPYPLYEFTSSPLAAGLSTPPPPDAEVPDRIPNTVILKEHFGELTFTNMSGENAKLTFQPRGVDGQPLGPRIEVQARDLD